MARQPKRLILSFIGHTDLKFLEPRGEDKSPILRLLLAALDPDSALQQPRGIRPMHTRLVLFDDDRPGADERTRFCERLREQLPGLGLSGLVLERHPVSLPDPNDLDALYEQVWDAIPTSGPECANEVVFHLSSGTPPMLVTLMLASQSLHLEETRLFETSRQQGVREVHPPYALALRKRRERERVGGLSHLTLSATARRGLLEHTRIDDPQVESAYAAIYKAATTRKGAARLVVRGPVGSGKWHACRQFAHWRGGDSALWLDPASPPDVQEGGNLLIRWLDAWPEDPVRELIRLDEARPDVAIAATFRTDVAGSPSQSAMASLEGLRGAAHIELPPLAARSDVVALAEALARQLGILDGKLKERLQYDLLTDRYPRNLHDLKTLLATADMHSSTRHPQRTAYVQARQLRDAQTVLDEAWEIVMGMHFGPGRHRLDEVLEVVRAAVVHRALVEGRSQKKAGDLLGFSQQSVSDILDRPLNLSGWNADAEVSGEPS